MGVNRVASPEIILCFLSSAFFLSFYFFFLKKNNNSLDSDQTKQFVGPDLDPNCLQRLSADKTLTHCILGNFSCFFVVC